jgi:hypothetical protein
MANVIIVRRDGSPVTIENVKHVLWKTGNQLLVVTGEHGQGRVYWYWPESVIDHVRFEETASGGHQ